MDIQTKIRYNYKQNLYYIEVKDPQTETTVVNPRMYEREEEAKIAEAILIYMYSKVLTIGQSMRFDNNEFDFNLKAIFRFLNTPNKW